MSLYDRIMRLRTDPYIETLPDGVRVAYKSGHKVARHDAAELSVEADELIEECECALSDAVEVHGSMHALKVLNKIKKFKEKNQ